MALHLSYAALLWPFSCSPERDVPFQVLPLSHSRLPLSFFDKQPGGMVGTGSLSKLFRDVEKWGERDVLQAPPSHILAYVLLFPCSQEDELFYSGKYSVLSLDTPLFSEKVQVLSLQVHNSLCSDSTCVYAVIYIPHVLYHRVIYF